MFMSATIWQLIRGPGSIFACRASWYLHGTVITLLADFCLLTGIGTYISMQMYLAFLPRQNSIEGRPLTLRL
jgi:hypothetical protein